MSKNYYTSGGFNVICDVCSKKIKASDAKQRWDGFIVCPEDFEQRHPQDFVRARQDKITIPFSRPRPVDAFILTEGFRDVVGVDDSLEILWDIVREFESSVSVEDSIVIFDTEASLNSYFYMYDGDIGSYIDITYFASDYIEELGSRVIDGEYVLEDTTVTITDTIGKDFTDIVDDSIGIVDSVITPGNVRVNDTVTIVENSNRTANKPYTDTTTLSDSSTTTNSKILADTTNVVDTIQNTTNKPQTDTTTVTDSSSREPRLIKSDTTTMSDVSVTEANKNTTDVILVTDAGNIFTITYVDGTYFASDYVGNYTTF